MDVDSTRRSIEASLDRFAKAYVDSARARRQRGTFLKTLYSDIPAGAFLGPSHVARVSVLDRDGNKTVYDFTLEDVVVPAKEFGLYANDAGEVFIVGEPDEQGTRPVWMVNSPTRVGRITDFFFQDLTKVGVYTGPPPTL